jgi:hypothetical protein
MRIIIPVFFIASIVNAYEGSTTDGDMVSVCPKLTCSEPLGDKVCYMHSSTNPVEWIKLMKCPKGY